MNGIICRLVEIRSEGRSAATMSASTSTLTCTNPCPYLNQRRRRRPWKSPASPLCLKYKHPISGNQESNSSHQLNIAIKAKGKSDVDPFPEDPTPPPAKRSSPEWRKWAVGLAFTMIIPSYRHRHAFAPLIMIRDKVDETIETAEIVTEIAEGLGEMTEKLAEAAEKKIPEKDLKLKEAAETIDRLAKLEVKEAKQVKHLIHQVEKGVKKVEIVAGIESEGEDGE